MDSIERSVINIYIQLLAQDLHGKIPLWMLILFVIFATFILEIRHDIKECDWISGLQDVNSWW